MSTKKDPYTVMAACDYYKEALFGTVLLKDGLAVPIGISPRHISDLLNAAYHDGEEASKAQIEELRKDRDSLRKFIEELVSSVCWGNEIRFPDDMDGGSVQDLAERMGILKAVDHPEPCSVENCPCIECGPVDFLYQFTWAEEPNSPLPA